MRTGAIRLTLALLAISVAAGCTTTSAGRGTLRDGGEQVTFDWQSTDSISGEMKATFSDGRSYAGKYFQVTSDMRVDRLVPLWDGWGPAWRGWPYWHADQGPQFVKHYSGRVLANLGAANGEYMRSRFRLIHPSSGMAGGGQGVCQLGDGKTIDATFPAT